MILADTSAWTEFLRRTGSRANVRMRELIADPNRLVVTDAVMMEVMAGARGAADEDRLGRLLWGCQFVRTEAPATHAPSRPATPAAI